MDLATQVKFAAVYSDFCNETHTPTDVSMIIQAIRENKRVISDEAKITLLQIPLFVLGNQVELKDEDFWSKKNGDYFAGNWKEEPLHSKFISTDFDLTTIEKGLQLIMGDPKLLNSDLYLRNPEVTLRDDVRVKEYSSFKESGKIFARLMEKAFDL